MDRKSIIILIACFVLIIFWPTLMRKFYPGGTGAVPPSHTATLGTNAPTTAATPAPAEVTGTSNVVSKFAAHPELPEQVLVLTNANAHYTFTSRGGGLQEVELIGYPETVSTVRRRHGVTNEWATLNAPTVPPLFAIIGEESLQGDNVYKLTQTPTGVHAEKTLSNGLVIAKDFQLGTNFLISISTRIENRSQKEITIPSYQWATGTATPMSPADNGMAQMLQWFDGSKASSIAFSYFNTNTTKLFGILPRTPTPDYSAGNSNVVWTAPQNQYFVMATMPEKPANAIVAHLVELPPPTPEELKDNPNVNRNPRGIESALTYPALKLPPGAVATAKFNLFAGPKRYSTLAMLASRFNNDIDRIMSFGWVGPVSKALLVTMNWFHDTLRLPYGWIIVFLTVALKAIFWPLTQASTRSAKRMQELQPQLKALQEKYKDDPQKLPQKQWEFYKKNNINPMAGCLPSIVQLPVFLGLYYMLRSAIELRGATFLWIGDLSKPDTVAALTLPFHFLGLADLYFPINPMPLIMGVTLLVQARLAPLSPSMDASQQKMMKYMPLMMLVFMYNLSSGLALYWTVSNMLAVVQTKLTRTQPAAAGPAATSAPAKPIASTPPQKKKK